ncbi:hypothetical protein [Massilia varians]|uniref:hypothetical protein n=1 Tax=Massilia varians TaxID=457921 RepID=UPI00255638AD|nr:hypothetical protein [Massilia varians]MDK6079544.1 hypothetical protein [Massilia varians]
MNALHRLLCAALLLVALLIGTWLGLRHYGAAQFEAGRAAAIEERVRADAAAVQKRTAENATEAVRQVATNATITEKKHEELAPVRERIVTRRVYVGSAICGDGPPGPAEAEDAGGSDSTDSAGRLVRADVERDIKALTLLVEEALATGRACQAWGAENGFMP